MHHDQMMRLYQRALECGAVRTSLMSCEWDAAGSCQSPVPIERYVAPEPRRGAKHVVVADKTKIPYLVRMHVPCRKCAKCLSYRARLWRERAEAEIAYWPRTWFGTLTLRPEEHLKAQYAAKADTFEERHAVISRWLTLWMKRLRKQSGASLRYLLVAEVHQGGGVLHGLPHYHVLIHEVAGQVLHKHFADTWPHGFVNFKLVDDARPAGYVAKYLAKDARARVRASGSFGRPEVALDRLYAKHTKTRPPETQGDGAISCQ